MPTNLSKLGFSTISRSLVKLSGRSPPTTKEISDEVPWSKIIGMRKILVHNYFAIDKDLVWSVIENDLPALKNQISVLLTND